ncbi:VOC family protein [Gimibacter soli]|uniref:VOC domain-containing protein n=1 Tax=Gimibacter soli TaxID=3024400 RepID=A0AAE9XTA1_9PROT|nr:hypothetical protein [Gimibacter soli]WCL54745.1 hypothetical protein PH603_03100 [Gimibacter soli]
MIRSATPVLPVDRVEASAAFFAKVGFAETVSVPEGDHKGFVILQQGPTQLMFQTRESLIGDSDVFKEGAEAGSPVLLFIEVDNIDSIEAALAGEPVVMEKRETFYGATEIGYREPGGHIVTFAQFKEGGA